MAWLGMEEKYIELAYECGFSHAGKLNIKALNFRQEVRDMCEAGKCGAYGHSWACPPYIGTLEESAAKAAKYAHGIIVQTTGEMEDSFDFECMKDTEENHKKNFKKLLECIRKDIPDILPMGAGTCTLCKKCSCPDEPCRFPDKVITSMEAYGLVVSDTCRDSDMKYYYGNDTITYTSCILM